jgi:hypothetical protein
VQAVRRRHLLLDESGADGLLESGMHQGGVGAPGAGEGCPAAAAALERYPPADPSGQSQAEEAEGRMKTVGIRDQGVVTGPVLVSEHMFCECGKLARHGIFCDRCWDEYSSLQQQWADRRARLVDPAYLRRMATLRQFFVALIVMLVCEGLWNFAIGLPINFRTVGISLGWAIAVAAFAALWHVWRSGAEKRGR